MARGTPERGENADSSGGSIATTKSIVSLASAISSTEVLRRAGVEIVVAFVGFADDAPADDEEAVGVRRDED